MGDFSERLKDRHDVSEKLILAFEDLLAVINTEPKNVLDEQDLMEKGIQSWHISHIGSSCGSDFANYAVTHSIDTSNTVAVFEDKLEKFYYSGMEAEYVVNVNGS